MSCSDACRAPGLRDAADMLSLPAFGRGNAAFVAINNQASAWKTTFKSGLAAGNCESFTLAWL